MTARNPYLSYRQYALMKLINRGRADYAEFLNSVDNRTFGGLLQRNLVTWDGLTASLTPEGLTQFNLYTQSDAPWRKYQYPVSPLVLRLLTGNSRRRRAA